MTLHVNARGERHRGAQRCLVLGTRGLHTALHPSTSSARAGHRRRGPHGDPWGRCHLGHLQGRREGRLSSSERVSAPSAAERVSFALSVAFFFTS